MEYLESTIETPIFAGNGLAPSTNKYHDFNAIITYSVMGDKYTLQNPELKIRNIICSNVALFNTSPKIPENFRGYPPLHCESMGILCVFVTGII